jgi:hypothetical protein
MRFIGTPLLFLLIAYFLGLILLVITIGVSACTYSIKMIHGKSTATTLIGEYQKANADIIPNINLHPLR